MSKTHTQILQSIQQAIDSDWHNWQKLSYIRSQIQGLLDQETRPDGKPPVMIVNLTIVNVAVPPTGQELQSPESQPAVGRDHLRVTLKVMPGHRPANLPGSAGACLAPSPSRHTDVEIAPDSFGLVQSGA